MSDTYDFTFSGSSGEGFVACYALPGDAFWRRATDENGVKLRFQTAEEAERTAARSLVAELNRRLTAREAA